MVVLLALLTAFLTPGLDDRATALSDHNLLLADLRVTPVARPKKRTR